MASTSPEPYSGIQRPTGSGEAPSRPVQSGATDPATREFREKNLRDTMKKHGLITEARRHQYLDVSPTEGSKRVEVSAKTIDEMATVLRRNKDILDRLASRENTPQGPMASVIRKSLTRWDNAAKFFHNEKDAHAPEGEWALTQADLDAGYYVLFSEMMQLGVFMGREVDYRGKGLFGLLGKEAYVHPQSPSYRRQSGLATDYMISRYGQVADPQQVEADLLAAEKTRNRFITELTGHNVNGRVMDRVNWGTCMQSLFERGRSGLALHDRILDQLEGNDSYQSILRRYSTQRGREVRTITDLLVNIDNPQDLRDALRLFHEAVGQASEERFGKAGTEFGTTHLTEKKTQWEEAGLIKNAEQQLSQLDKTGSLTPEQKTELQELQTQFNEIHAFMEGRAAGEGVTAQDGLRKRLRTLQDKINAYTEYGNRPQNDLATLTPRFDTADDLYREWVAGYPGGGLPPDVQLLQDAVTNLTTEIADIKANNPPYNALPTQRRAEMLNERIGDLTERNRLLSEAKVRERESAKGLRDSLSTRIDAIEGQLETRATAIDNAYDFIELEFPQRLTQIQTFYNRLDRIVSNPGDYAYLTAAQIVLITQQRDSLGAINLFLRNEVYDLLRKNPGELTDAYAARAPFVLNEGDFNQHVLDLGRFSVEYMTMLGGVRDVETQRTMEGAQLVLAAANGLPAREPQTGTPPVSGRAEIHRLLDFANKRVSAEADWKKLMTSLTRDHDLNIVRTILFDHPELKADSQLRNPDLWRRVFNDTFILESGVEFFGELDLPPAGALRGSFFDLGAANIHRQVYIEKMAASKGRFVEFLTYLVEKKLTMIADSTQTPMEVLEADRPANPGDTIHYGNQMRYGPCSRVFSADKPDEFWDKMDRDRKVSEKLLSGVWNIENIGHADQTYKFHTDRTINVIARESDPLVMTINHQRREIPYEVLLHRGTLGSQFRLFVQANPSLVGLVPDAGGNYDRRWVDVISPIYRAIPGRIGGRGFNNFDRFVELVRAEILPAGSAAADMDTFRDEFGNSVSRTLGDWFLGRSPSFNRADFPRFPDIAVPAIGGPAGYTELAAKYSRMSMDASGNIELLTTGAPPQRLSLNNLLENEQDGLVVDQALRLIGRQIFDIMGE